MPPAESSAPVAQQCNVSSSPVPMPSSIVPSFHPALACTMRILCDLQISAREPVRAIGIAQGTANTIPVVSCATPILDCTALFDPASGLEDVLPRVPAKWAVYLMTDDADRPVQLLCVKNLRYSLKRRLGEPDIATPSKRVDYRQIVRHIYWRRVFSSFEADWVYLEAARRFFPKSYRGMTGFAPAWFIHVDPDATFPRYTKTIDLDI